MDSNCCPNCGGQDVISGYCFAAGSGGDVAARFVPDEIKWREALGHPFGLSGVYFNDQKFRACLGCGMLWNQLQADQLAKYKLR